MKQWYVLHLATPLNETPMMQSLRRHKIDSTFWFPKHNTTKQLKKKAKPILKPVFSTYAFLECEYTPEAVRAIEEVSGCYFVVAGSELIRAITDDEMATLRDAIDKYTSNNTTSLKVWNNRKVEIISGCFAGYTAVVKAAVKDTIVAELQMFGRTVPVTLRQSEISAI